MKHSTADMPVTSIDVLRHIAHSPVTSPCDLLESWKAIASHLGRDVRTVQRWERERGLPVHRVPGGGRAPVYARKSELERWREVDFPDTGRHMLAIATFSGTGDEDANGLGDLLAQEILTRMSKSPSPHFATCDNATSLEAEWILEGSFASLKGRTRVWAHLAEVSSGRHVWDERFEGPLQISLEFVDQIAAAIVEAVSRELAFN